MWGLSYNRTDIFIFVFTFHSKTKTKISVTKFLALYGTKKAIKSNKKNIFDPEIVLSAS
jgi:hypothetical protein